MTTEPPDLAKLAAENATLRAGFHAATCDSYPSCGDQAHETDLGRAVDAAMTELRDVKAQLAALKGRARDLLDALDGEAAKAPIAATTRQASDALHEALSGP